MKLYTHILLTMTTTPYYKTYKQSQDALLRKIEEEKKGFFEKNDVVYKSKLYGSGAIIKLKYEDHCKFTKPWQYACRGSTFIKDRSGIYPFFNLNKFFNEHEFEKYYKISFSDFIKLLEEKEYKFLYMPKYDGTNIQCFFTNDGTLHIYTLGSVEKNDIHNTKINYYDLANELLQKSCPEILEYLEKNVGESLVCEILTPHNIIKTKYKFNDPFGKIIPIVLINKDGIPEFFKDDLAHYNCDHWDFNYSNYDSVKFKAFDDMVSNHDKYGDNPEGVVAYAYIDNFCFPISKMKREEYLKGEVTTLCDLQILKLQNKLDDHPLAGSELDHIVEFEKYIIETGQLFDKYDFLKTFLSLKEFTKHVNGLDTKLEIYKDSLYTLRRNGFEYTTGHALVLILLNTSTKDIALINKLQTEMGSDWFKSTKS
jgi:hypothetical protein